MAMIRGGDREKVRARLEKLAGEVTLVVFTQEMECDFCRQNRELVEEVASLSGKLNAEVKDFVGHAEDAKALGVDKIPAIAVLGSKRKDYGIRFYGVPAGYEFASLLESIELVSGADSGLAPATRQKLASVAKDVELQVFVTPTCPYCPRAVVQAFRFAMENERIRASMVEATEFPHLANKHGVSGVPHTVIGASPQAMVGAYPEAAALEMVLAAIS